MTKKKTTETTTTATTTIADAMTTAAELKVGCPEDGRVDDYRVKTEQIEDLISEFGEIESIFEQSYKPWLFSGLAWSYKFKLARSIVRLLDLNEGMTDAIKREQVGRQDTLSEMIVRTENQIDELSNLYNWAADQTRPDNVPSDEEVMDKLKVPRKVGGSTVAEYAEYMGVSLEEAADDLDGVISPDVEKAIRWNDEALAELKTHTTGIYPKDFVITGWNCVSTMEKIAEKSEIYAGKSKGIFESNKRDTQRKTLAANIKAFMVIMHKADKLAIQWRRDLEHEIQKAEELRRKTHEGSEAVMA